jgi:hypothetical protein
MADALSVIYSLPGACAGWLGGGEVGGVSAMHVNKQVPPGAHTTHTRSINQEKISQSLQTYPTYLPRTYCFADAGEQFLVVLCAQHHDHHPSHPEQVHNRQPMVMQFAVFCPR